MFLSIDPATSSGWAFFNQKKELTEYGFIKPPAKLKTLEEKMNFLYEEFKVLIHKYNIKEVFIEDFKVGGRNKKSAAESSYSIRAILRLLAHKEGCKVEVINITMWKSYINNKGRVTKEDKKLYGKDAEKIVTINSLKNKYNIVLPEKIKNPNTGNLINTPYDISDAIAIGLFALKL